MLMPKKSVTESIIVKEGKKTLQSDKNNRFEMCLIEEGKEKQGQPSVS